MFKKTNCRNNLMVKKQLLIKKKLKDQLPRK